MSVELNAEDVNCLARLEKQMYDEALKIYNKYFNEEVRFDYPCEQSIDELYAKYEAMGGRVSKSKILRKALKDSIDSISSDDF